MNGAVQVAHSEWGEEADPPLLLISGFNTQLINWREGFLRRLAHGGRRVIVFDNRDCGLSTKLDGLPARQQEVAASAAAGNYARAQELLAYSLSDMAGDAIRLLDELEIDRAHVLGVSMGGMIAQTFAIDAPERTLSLTSIMSNTGEPEFGGSAPASLEALLTPSPTDREENIAASDRALLWRSKRWPEREWLHESAAAAYDRMFYPEGAGRQMAAIVGSGPRADGLRALRTPTLVIHGLDDTLVEPSGGRRTAELVPGAGLMLVRDMGHDLPEPLWPLLTTAVLTHTAE